MTVNSSDRSALEIQSTRYPLVLAKRNNKKEDEAALNELLENLTASDLKDLIKRAESEAKPKEKPARKKPSRPK